MKSSKNNCQRGKEIMMLTYTMNLFNGDPSEKQNVLGSEWCERQALKDRTYDLLEDLSDYVDDFMIERVSNLIEEVESSYQDMINERDTELECFEEENSELKKDIEQLEKQLQEKEKLMEETVSEDGKEVDLESKEFKNLAGYDKARKELLGSIKKLQGVSSKKRIYLPKGVIKMVVFKGLEHVEELRLTSKEFKDYIRNNKDKGYNYRLELMGKLNCKTKIDWCN